MRPMRAPPAPVLVTGFEPFGGEAINPSWEVARALDGRRIAGVGVVGVQLPCVFARSLPALQAALRRHRPAAVLALGLAGSRSALGVERVAINWVDARIADNAGDQPVDQPVHPGGPDAYFTRLPAKALVQCLQQQGLPAEVSFSAGSFVCNQVFYGLMHALRRRPAVAAGFIHLPPLPQQAAQHPGSQPLPLADQVRALQAVVAALVAGQAEVSIQGGRVD
jgi:pyroglutamyl-peptidase